MSIVAKDDKGTVYLFTKGADDVLQQHLDNSQLKKFDDLAKQINIQTSYGYRALLLCYKKIDENWWSQNSSRLKKAKNNHIDQSEYVKLVGQLESNLNVLGAVFLEDELQDGVYDTIKFTREAGIRVWLITGDKTQTAISVSRLAGMITQEAKIIELDKDDILAQISSDGKQYNVVMTGRTF